MARHERMPRERAKTFVIYVCADNSIGVTPDCVGFYWFDSLEEAKEEFPDLPVRYVDFIWED